MGFNSFNGKVILRIASIVVTGILLYTQWTGEIYLFGVLLFSFLLFAQIISMVRFLNKSNEEIISFFDSIKYDELDQTFSTKSKNDAANKLNKEFNTVIDQFKEIRKEKEADFQYMRNIVQHVGIGLITFNKSGEIQLMNAAAKKLLNITQVGNVNELGTISPELVDAFFRLKTGGRDLLKLQISGEIIQLAVFAIELTLRGEEFKLISLQNIQNELEEMEMDAWQNLVRVLTHEIMNSVTPISSLAGTVENELKTHLAASKDINEMSDEDIEDLFHAVQTIQKRSKGLIRFVQDFRNLTHIPKPNFAEVNAAQLLKEIETLLKSEVANNNIQYKCNVNPKSIIIMADKELIEQVLINLIKNAIQAFDEQTNRIVEVTATLSDKSRPIITVKDNGNGIDDEALEKIFIPFFTTKKSGSGIGLSLSRQIMRKHQGTLSVKSVLDEGTEFQMKF
ncbi:MAG: ATP-binding protein [Bacteroidetes bacterium]|nr:MAG: ATP-binding protein [Bacteroidota bacterium]